MGRGQLQIGSADEVRINVSQRLRRGASTPRAVCGGAQNRLYADRIGLSSYNVTMWQPRLVTNHARPVAIGCVILLSLASPGCGHRPAHTLKQPARGLESPLVNQLVSQVHRSSDDPVRAALAVEISPLHRRQTYSYTSGLKVEAVAVRETLPRRRRDVAIMAALNGRFFGRDGFAAVSTLASPETLSFAAALDSRRAGGIGPPRGGPGACTHA